MRKRDFKVGDLVRMCTHPEVLSCKEEEIDWCYGLWLGKTKDTLAEGFGWAPLEHDRILYDGEVMVCDHYWHIERVDQCRSKTSLKT